MIDIEKIREDFPILKREIHPSIQLIYLDSAATSQKPESVIQAMDEYYRCFNANIHRGVYTIAEEATAKFEEARRKIGAFIGTNNSRQIIFTRNATEAINLVAYSWGRQELERNDVVILTEMEHHANLIPWQILASENGIRLEFIQLLKDGTLDLENYSKLLLLKPKLVSFSQMSNVLGTINPAKKMIEMAHATGALVLVDAAQSVPHMPVDVVDLDADFLAFSAHKMLGPTGIGVLFGKEKLLEGMPPFMGGGDMIKKVHLRTFLSNDLPYKFEAGTPAVAEVIGFSAAIDYLTKIGMQNVAFHEQEIIKYALEQLKQVPELTVVGPDAQLKGGVAAFTIAGIHPHDVAQILDADGIAVRAGHHCAMPLHEILELEATTRASFYLYNTKSEVDALVTGLHKVINIFK
jgi:cysteine desulfurase / selenocysteine lyase